MHWKQVGWTSCLAPIIAGCHLADHPYTNAGSEFRLAHTDRAIERRVARDAREAWREVRDHFSRRTFSAEFHDGFLDGYSEYLVHGGDGQPPATPPARYTGQQKYFTPEGHDHLRDYFLGFKYGADVARATGQRQFMTVPVLIADGEHPSASPPAKAIPLPLNSDKATPLPMTPNVPAPLPAPRPMSDDPIPKPGKDASGIPGTLPMKPILSTTPASEPDSKLPANRSFNTAIPTPSPPQTVLRMPSTEPESKFSSSRPNDVDATSPLPTPNLELPSPVSVPEAGKPNVPVPQLPRLPEPPPQVPSAPTGSVMPFVPIEIPMLPANLDVQKPLPLENIKIDK